MFAQAKPGEFGWAGLGWAGLGIDLALLNGPLPGLRREFSRVLALRAMALRKRAESLWRGSRSEQIVRSLHPHAFMDESQRLIRKWRSAKDKLRATNLAFAAAVGRRAE